MPEGNLPVIVPEETEQKLACLMQQLAVMQRVVVAYSGGVDSAFLYAVARRVLGDGAVAVMADSCFVPRRELAEAQELVARDGGQLACIAVKPLEEEMIAANPTDRCYHCKRQLLGSLVAYANGLGITHVVEGSNADDVGDYRPGMRAVAELGIKSPLLEAGLRKEEIRLLSKRLGLPTYQKPSFACLASRFAYGQTITNEGLTAVEQAEEMLRANGFLQYRVRVHEKLARVEVPEEALMRLLSPDIREPLVQLLTEKGFSYVTMDLKGFRSGSMNEGRKQNGQSLTAERKGT